MIRGMVRDCSFILLGLITKGNGKMVLMQALENCFILLVKIIQVTERTVNNMVKEPFISQMEIILQGIGQRVKDVDKVH